MLRKESINERKAALYNQKLKPRDSNEHKTGSFKWPVSSIDDHDLARLENMTLNVVYRI
jgi:hypothetical protein